MDDIEETPCPETATNPLGLQGVPLMEVDSGPSNSHGSRTEENQLVELLEPHVRYVLHSAGEVEILAKAREIALKIIAAGDSQRILDDPESKENRGALIKAAVGMSFLFFICRFFLWAAG